MNSTGQPKEARENSPDMGIDRPGPGFAVSVALVLVTAFTFVVSVLTPPLSGPLCAADCFAYPYHDIAGRFPRDYWWMFPALVLNVLLVAWTACLHRRAPERRRAGTLAGLAFAWMGAALLLVTYFVQLSVVQPSLLAGETEGLALLTQYNPHGLFLALEDLGYLLIALSFPCLAAAFPGRGGRERAARWTFRAGGFLAFAALVIISLAYGISREYRFELAVITIDWVVLLIVGTLSALIFRRSEVRSDGTA